MGTENNAQTNVSGNEVHQSENKKVGEVAVCEHKNTREPVVGWIGYLWCKDCQTHIKQTDH